MRVLWGLLCVLVSTASGMNCVAGTYSSGGACVLCAMGKYSSAANSVSGEPCAACGVGKFYPATGAEAESECIECPFAKYSSELGAVSGTACVQCIVDPAVADDCEPCGYGTYSGDTGGVTQNMCPVCLAGTSIDIDLCLACPVNSDSPEASSAQSDCVCKAGSTGDDGGPCSLCAAGTHKAVSGRAQCTECPAGTSSAFLGARTDGTCRLCAAGTYSGPGAGVCAPCPANYISSEGGECFECQPTTGSLEGDSVCMCVPGATGADGAHPCSLCPAGKHKPRLGNTACLECAAGKYAATEGMEDCEPCPPTTGSVEGSTKCNICASGATKVNGAHVCSLCPAGKHKPEMGSTACLGCAAGKYAATQGSVECEPCPANAFAPAASTVCACSAGFWGVLRDGACEQCPSGTHRSARMGNDCVSCAIGKVPTVGFTMCRNVLVCPGLSTIDNIAAEELQRPEASMDEQEKIDSSDVLQMFVARYTRQGGSASPACAELYERVVARLDADSGDSAVLVFNAGLVLLCALTAIGL